MGIKSHIFKYLFLLTAFQSTFAQSSPTYISHKVKSGDTYESISEKYNVSKKKIVEANFGEKPLDKNQVLVIPIGGKVKELPKTKFIKKEKLTSDWGYDTIFHIVKLKETMYSISRIYGVTTSELKSINNKTNNNLAIGEKLLILKPNFKKENKSKIKIRSEIVQSINVPLKLPKGVGYDTLITFAKHTILPGETIFTLANGNEISITDLFRYNPQLKKGIKVGETIIIPNFKMSLKPWRMEYKSLLQKERLNPQKYVDIFPYYRKHKVLPNETLITLAKKYKTTVEELKRINSLRSDNISKRKTLCYPYFDFHAEYLNNTRNRRLIDTAILEKQHWEINSIKAPSILIDIEKWRKGLTVDLFLPLSVHKIDSIIRINNIDINKQNFYFKNIPGLSFLLGVEFAFKKLIAQNYPITLNIYDANMPGYKFNRLLEEIKNGDRPDIIIGPFLTEDVEYVANYFAEDSIPIFSPFSSRHKIEGKQNLIQVASSKTVYYEKILNYLKKVLVNENLVFLMKNKNSKHNKYFFEKLNEILPENYTDNHEIKKYEIGNMGINRDAIKSRLSYDRTNFVIMLENSNISFSHSLLNTLNFYKDSTSNIYIDNIKDIVIFDDKLDELQSLGSNNTLLFTSYYTQINDPYVKTNLNKFYTNNGIYMDYFSSMGYDLITDIASYFFLYGTFKENLVANRRYGDSFVFDFEIADENSSIVNKGLFVAKYTDIVPKFYELKKEKEPEEEEELEKEEIETKKEKKPKKKRKRKKKKTPSIFNIFDF